MCAVIMHNLVKKRSLYINKWLRYSQLNSVSQPPFSAILEFVIRFVNVNVNIYNALEFPKEQKCEYLLWSIEAKMVQVCFELRSE